MISYSIVENGGNIYHYKVKIEGDKLFRTKEDAQEYLNSLLAFQEKYNEIY